jgi:hypothetical protein
MRCEVGRIPFFSLVHRPEDDARPVGMFVHPFTGETVPMCTLCAEFLDDQGHQHYQDSFPTCVEIYGL